MKIAKDALVSINYILKDDSGEVLDASVENAPFDFVFGSGFVIPGLENCLEGKVASDKVNAVITPENAYGEYNPTLIQVLPKEMFKEVGEEIVPGMQFMGNGAEGPILLTVSKILDDGIEVDGNHVLAGKTLHFDVEITGVREASEEELANSQNLDDSCCGGDHDDDHECCGGNDDHECCGGGDDHECCGGH